MARKVLIRFLPLMMIFVLMIAGCATTLAPSYDKALVDGLTTANTGVMEFLASVYGGTDKNTYDQRREKYANLIGKFNALEIQAKTRPVPKNKVYEKINEFLNKRGTSPIDDSETPSATAMKKISETLIIMRNTDQKQGVTSTEVQAFKNHISIYLDQALTYESFLER